jgi:hypothetical protein
VRQVYNVAGGKSLPEWLSGKKREALRKDEEFRRRIELIQACGCVRTGTRRSARTRLCSFAAATHRARLAVLRRWRRREAGSYTHCHGGGCAARPRAWARSPAADSLAASLARRRKQTRRCRRLASAARRSCLCSADA